MAQVNGVTNQLYIKSAALLNAFTMYVVCDKGALATIAAFTAVNNAAVSEEVANGFSRTTGTQSITNATSNASLLDTVQIYKSYTCNTNCTINGHEIMDAASSGNMYGYCAYNASQPMQVSDTLNAIMQFQFEVGA